MVSSQLHGHSATFLNKTLVKPLPCLVEAKSWVRIPRVLTQSLMAHPSQLGLQDAASPVIEELLHFHDHALIIVLLISVLVLYIIVSIVSTKLTDKYILDSQEIEIV